MTSKNSLPERKDVPIQETWDLTSIFSSDEACKKAQTELSEKTISFTEKYAGKLVANSSSQFLLDAVKDYEELVALIYRIQIYVSLRFSVDMRNDNLGKWDQEITALLARTGAAISFFDSELAQIEDSVFHQAIQETDKYQHFLQDKLEEKEHLLSQETEKVLAALSPSFSLPYSVYEIIKAQDITFPNFEANGQEYPLSYVSFENNYARDTNAEIRRNAFKSFSETLEKYHNTNAALMLGTFQKNETMAKLRGFESATEAALFRQKSTRELYDRQIDMLLHDLAPHMRRYAKLIQKEYQLDELHYADLLAPLDAEYEPEVTIKEAEQYISDAMKIMGDEYHDMMMASFPERWTDFAQNLGKSTGGFCTGVPEAHPYILLNWSGKLSEVFTLAHELGHAAQSILCAENNQLLEADMPFYLIESPSTAHELLLANSLLQKNKDPRFQRWVISSMIGNTYYHNAVTHLLEGAFQRIVMDKIADGESLSANDLDDIYLGVLKTFWGDTVIFDKGAEKTWMRQPHYYMNLYSYTYSASLVVSTDFYVNLEKNSEEQVDMWKKFLSTGGPLNVIEHAKLANVDLTTEKPLQNMIDFVGSLVDRLEELA